MKTINFDPAKRETGTYLAKKNSNSELTLYFYDAIGRDDWFGGGIDPNKVVQDINEAGAGIEKINVRIDSPGGSVTDGITIYNILAQNRARVIVYVDGLAASIASVIAMAGAERRVAFNATWMIHQPMGFAFGYARDMRKTADVLDVFETQIIKTYAKATGEKQEILRARMEDETWFDAEQSLAWGFATSIVDPVEAVNMKVPAAFAKHYRHMPKALRGGNKTSAQASLVAQRLGPLAKFLPAKPDAGKVITPARDNKE